MFIRLNNRRNRGQSTLEYGILITVVVGAFLAMAVFMKRGISGKIKDTSNEIGEQYSVGHTTSSYTTTTDTTTAETLTNAGISTTSITKDERDTKGSETVAALDTETW